MINCTFEDGGKGDLRHIAVTAICEKDNKILMVLRADHLIEPNKYGFPGGFLERDETISDGIKREILEETGYESEIKEIFRINDNPKRKGEDRQNVDFIFLVETGKKISEPDNEVKEVAWIDLENLPDSFRIAFDHLEIIELFKKYKKEKFALPIVGI